MQSYIVTQKPIRARNLMANILIGRNGPVQDMSIKNATLQQKSVKSDDGISLQFFGGGLMARLSYDESNKSFKI